MPIIEIDHVTKEYQLGHLTSFKESALNTFKSLCGKPVPKRQRFKALDDISFSVKTGEVVGVIGHNGAGKSTLLKHLANISKPTKGRVVVRGNVAPLIELGAGVSQELTGRENIYLNGAILGIPKKVIKQKLDEIIAFSELEAFIDTPVKRYSSGMAVKLGFSIATTIDSDILIVDEVLAVGDLAFQRKCFDRMESLIKDQGRTVLLVSHNIRQVQRLCSRVVMLEHGRVKHDGDPQTVCDLFYEKNDEAIDRQVNLNPQVHLSSGEMELLDVQFVDHLGQRSNRLAYNEDCQVQFHIRVLSELNNVAFNFGFHTTDFLYLTSHCSEAQISSQRLSVGEHVVACKIAALPLLPGVYSLRFGLTAGQAAGRVFYAENIKHFHVSGTVPLAIRDGFFALDAEWAIAG